MCCCINTGLFSELQGRFDLLMSFMVLFACLLSLHVAYCVMTVPIYCFALVFSRVFSNWRKGIR